MPAYYMRISDWSSDVCSSDLHQVALFHAAVAHRLVKRERHRRGRGVGVAIDRYDDLFGRKAQLLCRALQDAHIGLVRNNPVDIARRKAERIHCFHQHIGKRSEEHTSELQSLMRNSYAVFCLKKK